MKKLQKLIVIIIVLVLVFLLAACGSGKPKGDYTGMSGAFRFSGSKVYYEGLFDSFQGTYELDGSRIIIDTGDGFGDEAEYIKGDNVIVYEDERYLSK